MSTGKLVNATSVDSVRIEVLGNKRAVTIPCSLIESTDANLRKCVDIGQALIVYPFCGGWLAECGDRFCGTGATPFQAIANMESKQ